MTETEVSVLWRQAEDHHREREYAETDGAERQ